MARECLPRCECRTGGNPPAYRIVRRYQSGRRPQVLARGLTLAQAQEWCADSETSSRTAITRTAMARTRKHGAWFDSYEVGR